MPGARRDIVGALMVVIGTGAVLLRVGLVVAVAMAIFLIAFLGYFVLPFIFVLLALGIMGVSGTLREWIRLRTRRGR